jgi:hypothetical protein
MKFTYKIYAWVPRINFNVIGYVYVYGDSLNLSSKFRFKFKDKV